MNFSIETANNNPWVRDIRFDDAVEAIESYVYMDYAMAEHVNSGGMPSLLKQIHSSGEQFHNVYTSIGRERGNLLMTSVFALS
jgi:hypothetical protein